ncbi:hypothetical protein DPMN_100131 [Dreissena polymorpha]|uniref:Uncharacterized protein n=1 Tax=Dreissena polymorpha TaxID=45954 RepID=A0A9D4R8D5_DREPO|nr:hypothetical protein DPMN_100131 [Dreissena polymorpha]
MFNPTNKFSNLLTYLSHRIQTEWLSLYTGKIFQNSEEQCSQCRCPRCLDQARPIDGRPVTQVVVDGSQLDVEANFCYLIRYVLGEAANLP